MDSNNYQRFSLDRMSDAAIIPYQWISEDISITSISAPNNTRSPNSVLNYPFSYPQYKWVGKRISFPNYYEYEVMSPTGVEKTMTRDSTSDRSVYPSASPQTSHSSKSSRYTIRSEYDPEKDYYSPSSPSGSIRSSLSSPETYYYPFSIPVDEVTLNPEDAKTQGIALGQSTEKTQNVKRTEPKENYFDKSLEKKFESNLQLERLGLSDNEIENKWLYINVGSEQLNSGQKDMNQTSMSLTSEPDSIALSPIYQTTTQSVLIDDKWEAAKDPIEPRPAKRDPEWAPYSVIYSVISYEPVTPTE